jgi:tetratricopeptide (TPR) repeat protein
MNRSSRKFGIALLVFALAVAASGCQKLQARDNLNKGVTAYKASQFEKAIEFFKKAKEQDPELLNARLYLATAYAAQFIPGAPSDDNINMGKQAIEEFQNVLQIDPRNLSAIDGIGSLLYQMGGTPYDPKKFEESRSYHLKHIEIKPDDPEPYYWVGVIEWTLSWRANRVARANWNETAPAARKIKKDEDPLPDKVREEFAAKYSENVENGIKHLLKAIELNPEYENAMAYLNLLYRQKADIVATSQERNDLLAKADALVDRVKEIKQKKATETAPTS